MPALAIMSNFPVAQLIELFSSAQGEGPYVGARQVFLRFSGCNLACNYCDTVRDRQQHCQIEGTPGRGDFDAVGNPVSLETVVAVLTRWEHGWPGLHHSLSITGGEPLLAVEILEAWLPVLRRHLPVLLETNGTLPDAFVRVREWISILSMDIKLPSTTGKAPQWEVHQDFLGLAQGIESFVKVVVSQETEDWEIQKSASLIAHVSDRIPLILQPMSPLRAGETSISALRLLELQEMASRCLRDVRIIPQTHKYIGAP